MKTVGADGKETTDQATYQLDGKTLTATSKNVNAKDEDIFVLNKQQVSRTGAIEIADRQANSS